jgi:hypothetical protein
VKTAMTLICGISCLISTATPAASPPPPTGTKTRSRWALAAGVAVLIKQLMPQIKVIAVEAEDSACLKAALDVEMGILLQQLKRQRALPGNHHRVIERRHPGEALLGLKALIVMPVATADIKVDAVRGFGGEVLLHGANFCCNSSSASVPCPAITIG